MTSLLLLMKLFLYAAQITRFLLLNVLFSHPSSARKEEEIQRLSRSLLSSHLLSFHLLSALFPLLLVIL